MFLYEDYELNAVGHVGQPLEGSVRVVNGVQHVEPQLAGGYLTTLANRYIDVSGATAVSEGEATLSIIATTPPEGETNNALQVLQELAPGSVVMVDVSAGIGPSDLQILISTTAGQAVEGSDWAILDVSKGVLKADEQETLPLVIGVAAGGGVGFMTFGMPGAIGGAIGGYFLANWLT
jgi:hypothetical protein